MPLTAPLVRLLALLSTLVTVVATSPSSVAAPTWRWPTAGGQASLIRPFQPPLRQYGTGHRGIDLQVTVGQQITAPAPGVITFYGLVARIPTLVIDHGGALRSTYQPITTALKVGEAVNSGAVIGVIAKGGGHCLPRTCLHWGVRNSVGYLDPLRLIRPTFPVLLPLVR